MRKVGAGRCPTDGQHDGKETVSVTGPAGFGPSLSSCLPSSLHHCCPSPGSSLSLSLSLSLFFSVAPLQDYTIDRSKKINTPACIPMIERIIHTLTPC